MFHNPLSAIERFVLARSVWGLLLLGFMCAGAAFQSYLALKFWGSWGDPAERWIWQAGGIVCAWAVMILLAAASEFATRKREFRLRWSLRAVAMLFLAFNLACDIGAVEAHTAADEAARSAAHERYTEARAIVGDPSAEPPVAGRDDARITDLQFALDGARLRTHPVRTAVRLRRGALG